MRLVLAFLLTLAGESIAFAMADPCAKISDADAYNNCLAGVGPVAKSHKLGRAPAPDEERSPRREPALGARRPLAMAQTPHDKRVERKRNGRVRVEIFR